MYRPNMNTRAVERQQRSPLPYEEEFEVHYQPVIELPLDESTASRRWHAGGTGEWLAPRSS